MRCAPLIGVVLALLAPVAGAQVMVTPDDAGKILLRAISFDRSLAARAGTTLVIAVVSRAGDPTGVADGSEMAAALRKLAETAGAGTPVKVESWPVIKAEEVAARLKANPAAMLYVSSGFDPDELRRIAAAAEATKALCTYRAPGYDGMLALGVLHLEARARLVINLVAAQRAGADFAPRLLRLALVR